MALDTRFIGHALAPYTVPVEAGRLKFFAKATGQADVVYRDEAAARASGHSGLPVPPTFLFCLEMDAPNPGALRDLLNIDIANILHGEQRFVYHRPVHAGDVLTFEQRIDDLYSKKGGALDFLVRASKVCNQRGEHVADLVATTVVRNPGVAPSRATAPAPAVAVVANPPPPAAATQAEVPGVANPAHPTVGQMLPGFTTPPLSRLTLALYCGASGDHNPIHVDIDFAKAAGFPDVFAHGMLSMGWLGRLLTDWQPQAQLREFGVRFVALTRIGEAITASGHITELFEADGERRARIALQTANAAGEVKLQGDAVVALLPF